MRRSLPIATDATEGLGRPTIMDRALAARHGMPYVHLAAFAIDVDRVREAHEDLDDPLPFAWEVFLTECYLLERLDAAEASHTHLVEDAVLSVIESSIDGPRLGAQLPFAVWDAVARGVWPAELEAAFGSWKTRPGKLVRALAPLWREQGRYRRDFAAVCLGTPMQPPLAPPTIEALERLREAGP